MLRSRRIWIWTGTLIALAGPAELIYQREVKPLKIALNRPWANVHPGLQHTRNGDLVLSNQFDALVGLNESGTPIPLGAKSWEISDDYKRILFKIDSNRKFSDGSPLTAADYKRSWEESLSLLPISSNSAVADIMTWVRGFDEFSKTKTLSGVRVLDGNILEVEFSRPVRLVLDFLSGNRFSAFKHGKNANEFIGTGHFFIRQVSADELRLEPNRFCPESATLKEISVIYLPPEKAREAITKGDIDAIGYSLGAELLVNGKIPEGIQSVAGQDAFHDVLIVNGLEGRLFANWSLRRALQWLVATKIVPNSEELKHIESLGFFEADPQVFLPFQAGRLEKTEVESLLGQGEKSFADLVQKSKSAPLLIWVTEATGWLLRDLRAEGITLSEDSRVLNPKEIPDAYYKSFQPDIMVLGISVTNGDPDGIYHALGKHGAITSPMIQRPKVAQFLEDGRGIIDYQLLPRHYAKVSRAILEEVPFIHLGFSKTVALVRKDRVELDRTVLLRNEGHFNIFKSKR